MSDGCCAVEPLGVEASICPGSGDQGVSVAWSTVAALVRGRVPAKQEFWLCREPSCPLVYFGSDGTTRRVGDLRVSPGFKVEGDGLLCYCFEVRESDIRSEISATGHSNAVMEIGEEVRAGNCACEVRNPSGKCCLGEVGRAVRNLEREIGVAT